MGSVRRLIIPTIPYPKSPFVAPELIEGKPFDGFTVDIFSAGVILFALLIGECPFETAGKHDPRYQLIAKNRLSELMDAMKMTLS
ncbi:MAG: hypothetical protein RQ806_06160, partial [Erythrobacter sp.]|nr:hypothetical protein [Erythrobacter sp.]